MQEGVDRASAAREDAPSLDQAAGSDMSERGQANNCARS